MRLLLRYALSFLIFTASAASTHALVGTSELAPELTPYVVMVLKRSQSAAGFCSGVVLTKDVILTAAHCAADPADTRIHFRNEHGEPVLINVAAILKHPGYRADAVRSRQVSIDLALVRLAEPLPARFSPMTLAEPNNLKIGQDFRIAGFGVTKEGVGATSGTLRTGRIAARAPLSSILLWAEDPQRNGTGACTGDSGGPILAPDQPILIAITDWAEGTGKQKCGGLTQGALIAPQRYWIESVLASWDRAGEPQHR
jgi:secreted trypsin-like serine protease